MPTAPRALYVTMVALDQEPVLAPMFNILHVVFVGASSMLLPYRVYVARAGTSPGWTLSRG